MGKKAGLSQLELQKGAYRPICTPSEIERLFNPENAQDYLLALRSNYIIDHMRIFRFFLRALRVQGSNYSLESNFETDHYCSYLEMLTDVDREKLSSVTFGDVFTTEPQGEIFASLFGRIVTVSRSIRYFLEYSLLALKKFSSDIPAGIRLAALIIALRVMFEHEAMDFEVDPRGKLDERLQMEIRKLIPRQLQFIVGHEFAHHLLGHLSDSRVHETLLRSTAKTSTDSATARAYSVSQQEELNADVAALMRPQVADAHRADLLNAALIWFAALELYQHARDVIEPIPPCRPRTHPSARDRHLHLLREVETRYRREMEEVSESAIRAVDSLKRPISEYLSLHIESFETYGSMYLGAPNTDWRGPALVDRKDYY